MHSRTTWSLLIATGVSLGCAIPLGKLAVNNGIAPISFVMLPALVAGLLLAAIAALRHGAPTGLRKLALFGLVTGLLGNAIPNTLTAWLAAAAGASFAAIAYTLPPVFTLLLTLLLGFEPLRWLRILAVVAGLSGALWLASARVSDGHLAINGALALFSIPAAIGFGNIYRARFLPQGVSAEWLGSAMTLGSFTWLLPVWVFGPVESSAISAAGLPFLAAQVASAALAAVLFFQLQRRADPVTMSFVGYAMALTALLLGAWLLGEQLPPQLLPAAALIGAGFWLVQRQSSGPLAQAGRA